MSSLHSQKNFYGSSHYHSIKDKQYKKLNGQCRDIDKGLIDNPCQYKVFGSFGGLKPTDYNFSTYESAIKLFNQLDKATLKNSFNEIIKKK